MTQPSIATLKYFKQIAAYLVILTMAYLLTGCRQNPQVYQVPKESIETHTVLQKHVLTVTWNAPATWVSQPVDGVRKASYKIGTSIDGSVTSFPGSVGGLLSNINRWRAQIGLAPITQDQLTLTQTSIPTHHGPVTLWSGEMKNDQTNQAILGAILPLDTETWFFKLSGSLTDIQSAQPDFNRFINSITLTDPNHD